MNPRQTDDRTARNIAENVKKLRELRGMTQDQLARLSGVPRPTWANLESGEANPTVAVLVKVASGLQVPVEELISPPRATVRFYSASEIPIRRRGPVSVRKVLPDSIQSVNLERMEFEPGGRMVGVPHRSGTREYLTCETGVIELSVSGERWRLSPGDVIVFRGDQKHSYANLSTGTATAYSVVLLGPIPE